MTESNPTYNHAYASRWVRRQTSMLCIDGQRRNDCVILLEIGHGTDDVLCGKPMVGIVAWPGRVAGDDGTNWGARMCKEHFEQWTHDLDNEV